MKGFGCRESGRRRSAHPSNPCSPTNRRVTRVTPRLTSPLFTIYWKEKLACTSFARDSQFRVDKLLVCQVQTIGNAANFLDLIVRDTTVGIGYSE